MHLCFSRQEQSGYKVVKFVDPSCAFPALMYSVFGVLLSYGRGVDDELNTVVAGTATGLLYKSSGKACFIQSSQSQAGSL